jgi:general secretion pathway protein I
MIKSKKGFTLLETLLAMIILSTGILLLTNSWSGSFLRIRKTQLNSEVSALLERKMVEVEAEYKDKPLESIPEEKEDDFGSDYPQYSWKLESQEFKIPDLSAGMTSRDGGANEMLLSIIKQLSEHLNKSVKEVRVTVLYKPKSGKELSFSVTRYYVDFNKELPMPGVPSSAAPGGL